MRLKVKKQSKGSRLVGGFYFALIFIFFPFSAALHADAQAEDRIDRRQKVELLSFFLKDPKDAELPKTTLGINLLNQAVAYYQKNDFEMARKTLRDVLKQDNLNPYAYELLGDIYNNEQNLKEAKSNYEIAYNLQPSDNLKKKMETLGKEVKADQKLSTYKEEHFIIKYHDQEKNIEGFELRELLRQTYRSISQDLGYYFNYQVVVLLLDEEEFKQITDAPHWAGGVYDGKIRMPLKSAGFKMQDLKALTAHEVTHAFIAAISARRAPAWVNEGLAQYEENKIRKIDAVVFESAVKTKTLLPLDQLMSQTMLMEEQDALRVNLFYQQSLRLTEYLIKRYDMFHLKKLLSQYGEGKNSDEAIRNVYQISIARLEKEWLATVTK